MDRALLCTWLNLAETTWPPDHYSLLGFAPGEGRTEELEQRVLERMDLLRRYQLMHPETVTEGMNLLAQAMICLTDPVPRREYDRQIGRVADEPLELPDADDIRPAPLIELPLALPPEPKRTSLKEVDYPLPIPYPLEGPPEKIEADDEEVEPEPLPATVQPTLATKTVRRELYAELVRIRRVLRIWDRLRLYLDDPAKAFLRRTETVAFMNCLAELRPLLPTVADLVGSSTQPGKLVAALAKQQLVVEMFRSLLPSQRESLSKDCRSAHFVLREHYQKLRAEVRRQTAKGFTRRIWLPLVREVIFRPEWVMLAVGLLALTIAFVRSVPK